MKKDGKLFFKFNRSGIGLPAAWLDVELPITKVGTSRFSVTPPGMPQAMDFMLGLRANGESEYLQMFVWAFRRVETNK